MFQGIFRRNRRESLQPIGVRYSINEGVTPEAVASLREAVGWDGRAERYALILPASFLYVGCFVDEKLVGFVRAISDGVDDAVIFDLAVLPQYQHHGIGSKLIDKSIAFCADRGIKAVNVLFEPHLSRFYENRGFIQIRSGVIDTEAMTGPWRLECIR